MQQEQPIGNLEKFFKNLLKLKRYVKDELDKNNDPVIEEIYRKLDKIIKDSKEGESNE